jgi:hypothetical protein
MRAAACYLKQGERVAGAAHTAKQLMPGCSSANTIESSALLCTRGCARVEVKMGKKSLPMMMRPGLFFHQQARAGGLCCESIRRQDSKGD